MTTGLALSLMVFTFSLGMMTGTRMIRVIRLRLWERIDNLIYLIEQVAKLSPDGRIDPAVTLGDLYSIKQSLRISERNEAQRGR